MLVSISGCVENQSSRALTDFKSMKLNFTSLNCSTTWNQIKSTCSAHLIEQIGITLTKLPRRHFVPKKDKDKWNWWVSHTEELRWACVCKPLHFTQLGSRVFLCVHVNVHVYVYPRLNCICFKWTRAIRDVFINEPLCPGASLRPTETQKGGRGSKHGSVARGPPLCLDEMRRLQTLKTSCH